MNSTIKFHKYIDIFSYSISLSIEEFFDKEVVQMGNVHPFQNMAQWWKFLGNPFCNVP